MTGHQDVGMPWTHPWKAETHHGMLSVFHVDACTNDQSGPLSSPFMPANGDWGLQSGHRECRSSMPQVNSGIRSRITLSKEVFVSLQKCLALPIHENYGPHVLAQSTKIHLHKALQVLSQALHL